MYKFLYKVNKISQNDGSIKGYEEQNVKITSVAEQPYFEGDLWADFLEVKLGNRKKTSEKSENMQDDVILDKNLLRDARDYLKKTKKVSM